MSNRDAIVTHFDPQAASASELREEAEDVLGVCAAIMFARERGHCDLVASVDALKLYSHLRQRASELKHLAELKAAPAHTLMRA